MRLVTYKRSLAGTERSELQIVSFLYSPSSLRDLGVKWFCLASARILITNESCQECGDGAAIREQVRTLFFPTSKRLPARAQRGTERFSVFAVQKEGGLLRGRLRGTTVCWFEIRT